MTESILQWMQKNESRFFQLKNSKFGKPNSFATNNNRRVIKEIENPQKKMDAFFSKKKSGLFDENFSKADFDLLTKLWKEKYLQD